MYQHRDWQGNFLNLPVGKVVCVGKNYADHIKEMGGYSPKKPLLFMKPETALCHLDSPLNIPDGLGAVAHEIELAILIGSTLTRAGEEYVEKAIAGYGVALDLTLRDLQNELKECREPWEKAKAFDKSCPISGFISADNFPNPQNAELKLTVNGEIRQYGNTQQMITPIIPLISYMSQFFTLREGDIILTGTPSGLGNINVGDQLCLYLNDRSITTCVL